MAQPRTGCKYIWESLVWIWIISCTFTSKYCGTLMNHPGFWFLSQLHWSVPRHAILWQKILAILPATFPLTVLTISEEYSGSLEADMSEKHPSCSSVKWEVILFFCLRVFSMQSTGHSHRHRLQVYMGKACLWNIHESPRLMIPTPAAFVCPKTYDTVAEDACNIASHLSIDRTHDKEGILRQARHIQAVLKQTCQRNTQVGQVWSEKSFLSLFHEFFGCKQHGTTAYRLQVYMGKSCLNLNHKLHLHKQVLWNINESPWLMIPNQQHWSVPRQVTLWHKMLVILPATFPLTVLTTSEEYSAVLKQTCQRITQVGQVWSEKSFLSLVQEFFGCKQHGTATCRLQVYMGKSCLKQDHTLRLHKQALGNINESPWLMIPIPAAVVCPKTCDSMAEDTCNIASHLSIDRLSRELLESFSVLAGLPTFCQPTCSSVKWQVLRLFCLRVFWMQSTGHRHVQVASVYGQGLFETLYKQVLWNINESPWLMIPTPAALVCPKTCDTVAENACNIASHLSMCEVRSLSSLLSKSFLDASSMAQPRTGCKYIW